MAIKQWQVKRCIQIAYPYSHTNTEKILLEDVDRCLAKMYISFPFVWRGKLREQINECIGNLVELEKSKPEYRAIQKTVVQITSNLGDSIVDAQHSVGQLAVCSEPLKHITNMDIYEESRFDTITKGFVENLKSSDKCLEESIQIISSQSNSVNSKISEYKTSYAKWLNMTAIRQENAEMCKKNIEQLVESISNHIVREFAS